MYAGDLCVEVLQPDCESSIGASGDTQLQDPGTQQQQQQQELSFAALPQRYFLLGYRPLGYTQVLAAACEGGTRRAAGQAPGQQQLAARAGLQACAAWAQDVLVGRVPRI
jgi:hypothetical protein